MKHLFKTMFVTAFVAAIGYGIYTNQEKNVMSDLMLANAEALANDEASAGDPCYKGSYNSSFPKTVKCAYPCTVERCGGTIDKYY